MFFRRIFTIPIITSLTDHVVQAIPKKLGGQGSYTDDFPPHSEIHLKMPQHFLWIIRCGM
jgi:hypothetical protein